LESTQDTGSADKPKVWNIRNPQRPNDAVYIGRPSKWGNPYVIGRDGSRELVIARYRDYILKSPLLGAVLKELRGKHLVCFCAPLPCHGDVLLEIANA
jgi:hypothetical protein